MCYKKPGPRCSKHAREALRKAVSMAEATDSVDLKSAVVKARHLYYETPEGLKHLSSKLGEDSEIYKLFSDVRKNKMKAYKQAYTIPNKETIFGTKKFAQYNKKVEDALRKNGLWEKSQEQQAMLEKAVLDGKPLNTSQLTAHANYVSKVVDVLNRESLSTEKVYSRETPAGPIWKKERAKLHEEIISSYMDKYKNVPCDSQLFVAGGMGGSGKTSTIDSHNVVDKEKYAVVNPDDIKEDLIRKKMVPHIPGTMGMEVNALAHEEASLISKKLMGRLIRQKKNVILDITMASEASTESKIKQFKNSGYKVNGMFVDVDVETSKTRATSRYITSTQQTILSKEGSGGRYLPPQLVDKQKSFLVGVNSINAEAFHSMNKKGLFDSVPRVFDNRGSAPVEMSTRDFLNVIENA